MVFEIYYRNTTIAVGHEYIRRDFHLFLPSRSNRYKNTCYSMFEEHSRFFKSKHFWSNRRFWNFFCWFFFKKYNSNMDNSLDFKTATIVFWDMLGLYKAWRHCRGYPVNGQRTWSNGKSCTKNNNNLRFFRLQQFQTAFGVKKKSNYATLVQAEAVNKLWLKTWPFEWIQGRYHAIRSKSRKGTSIPIDVVNLAKAITTGYRRYGAGERWNNSKKALKTVTVGLPLYFSRFFYGVVKKKYFRFQLTMLQPDAKNKNKQKKKSKKKQIKKKQVKKK